MRLDPKALGFGLLVAGLGWGTPAVAQPANDDCANATVVTGFPFADSVDMTTATTAPGDPTSFCLGGAQGTNSVWYRLPAEAAYLLRGGAASGSGSKYGVSIFTGGCGALVEKWCNVDSAPPTEVAVAAEGQEVWIEVVNAGTVGTLDFTLDALPEFLVDAGGKRRAAVAGGPHGFLVTWREVPPHAQRVDATGTPVGAPIPLPSYDEPDVAGAGDGSFVIVGETGAARVEVDDSVVPMPSVVPGGYPRVAADDDGDFVVVWGGSGQVFERDGTPVGPVFDVTTGFAGYSAVAMAANGDFVVVWDEADDGSGGGIGGRLFDATGAPAGPEFIVNTYTTLGQYNPGVAMDAAGNFVVAWAGNGYRYVDGEGYFEDPVVARRFTADGTPRGPEFFVTSNPDYYGTTGTLDVAMGAAGDFMVTWEGFGFTVVDIHARRFQADGTPVGPQFFVNTFDGYSSYDPDIGATTGGDFMVAWNDFRGFIDDTGPGSEDAVLGRVFPAPGLGCTSIAKTGCRTPTIPLKSKLLFLDRPDDTDDQLRWKFVKGTATDAADLGDPTADEGYVLCLYDASSPGGALLMENRIPASGTCGSKPCWKALGNPAGSKGYRYKDNDRTPHGIQKMVLKPGADGKSKVVIKGGQDHVFDGGPGTPALPLTLPVTVQLQNASGACWQATYDTAGVGVNEPGFYKGSGS